MAFVTEVTKHSGYVLVQLSATATRKYTYFNHDPSIREGDHVVIDVGGSPLFDAMTTFKVVKVVEVDPPEDFRKRATKWIVCKVDTDAYLAATELMKSMQGDEQ